MSDPLHILRDFLRAHDLPREPEVLSRFEAYLELLEKGRKRFNLIGPLQGAALVRELFCDSLMLAVCAPPLGSLLDVGSGAGFPGIPLKLVFPELPLTLVEPREKRYRFLGHVIRTLGLEHVTRHRERIEDLELSPFGTTCSKAVFAPLEWLDVAAPLTRSGGRVALLCAREAWDDACRERAAALGLSEVASHPYRWDEPAPERMALLLEKPL